MSASADGARLLPGAVEWAERFGRFLDDVRDAAYRRDGIVEWRYPYPVAGVEAHIRRDGAWVLVDAGGEWRACAVVADEDPAWADDVPALYVVLIAAMPGEGWGGEMMEGLARVAAERSRSALRMGCPQDAARLRAYWQGRGFRWRRNMRVVRDGGMPYTSLYERAVG